MDEQQELVNEQGAGTEATSASGSQEPVAPSPEADSQVQVQSEGADLSSIDLSQLPQFRKYQSESDRRIAQMRQEHQTQLAEMEKRLEEVQMRGMDSGEKERYLAQKREREAGKTQGELTQLRNELARRDYLAEVNQRYGVPMQELVEAANPQEVQERVVEYVTKREAEKVKTMEQRLADLEALVRQSSPNNAVDTGGGGSQAPDTELDALKQRYNEAMTRFDSIEVQRIMREAQAEGIDPNDIRG